MGMQLLGRFTRFSSHAPLSRIVLGQGAQSESKQLFHRAEAAQCLQSCDRLRSRRMAVDSGCDPSLSVFRNPQLGSPAGCSRNYRWVSNRVDNRLGI